MKAAIGGLIALVLLGLYVYAVVVAVQVVYCVTDAACTGPTAADFTDGMASAMATIGGLISALVIAELAITRPGDPPAVRTFDADPQARVNTVVRFITIGYLLVWVGVGLWAFVVGVMQHPKVLQPLTDLGQAWLGLAVAAVYAYFGITPRSGA